MKSSQGHGPGMARCGVGGQLRGTQLAPMPLPTAMIVGPMKAGTTWIYDYLAARDDVAVPTEVKETFFFERNFHRGVEWYAAHFDGRHAAGAAAVVEVAPSLFHQAEAPARVKAVLGDVPIVVTTREPVARSWSHYLHLRRYGYTANRLEDAVADFPEIIAASQYDRMLENWREHFRSITVLRLEELNAEPEGYIRQLSSALSIPRSPISDRLPAGSNEGAEPYSIALARLGDGMAHRLRSAGMYRAVNFAKRLGLKKVFFGRPGRGRPLPTPSDAEKEFILSCLRRQER